MRKLGLISTMVFVVGTLLAVLAFNDGDGAVIDMFTIPNRSGVHYYFVVRAGKARKTMEVTEAAYRRHSYGDIFDQSWLLEGSTGH